MLLNRFFPVFRADLFLLLASFLVLFVSSFYLSGFSSVWPIILFPFFFFSLTVKFTLYDTFDEVTKICDEKIKVSMNFLRQKLMVRNVQLSHHIHNEYEEFCFKLPHSVYPVYPQSDMHSNHCKELAEFISVQRQEHRLHMFKYFFIGGLSPGPSSMSVVFVEDDDRMFVESVFVMILLGDQDIWKGVQVLNAEGKVT